MFNIK